MYRRNSLLFASFVLCTSLIAWNDVLCAQNSMNCKEKQQKKPQNFISCVTLYYCNKTCTFASNVNAKSVLQIFTVISLWLISLHTCFSHTLLFSRVCVSQHRPYFFNRQQFPFKLSSNGFHFNANCLLCQPANMCLMPLHWWNH